MRDLNKSYKKIDWFRWHQRKRWIQINCFLLTAILVIVLLLMFPIVSDAEENQGVLADYYTINDVYNKTDGLSYCNTTYVGYQYFNAVFNYGPFSDDNINYSDDILDVFKSDYNFQSDLGNTQLGSVSLYFFTLSGSDELRFCFNTSMAVRGNWTKNPPEYYEVQFPQSASYKIYKISDGVVSYDGTLASASSYKSLAVTNIITATGPIMIHSTNYDVNYLTAQNKCSNSAGGCGLVRSYANEDASNNLYLQESDFIFTHQTYYAPYNSSINTGSAVPVGTITFKGQPNDYQIEHASEFYVQLYFNFDYDVDYKNQTGNDIMDFKKTGAILGNEKNLYYFFTTPTNGPTYKMSLNNFINNGNSYSVAISDVFNDLTGGSGRTLAGVLNQSKEVTELSYNSFKLTCNAFIVGNGLASQGKYTEWYNFNSKKGFTTDDSLNTNPNPYTPNPSTQADDDPDSTNIQPTPNVPGPGGSDSSNGGGSSSSSSQSNPNIVITNNPTFNNNSNASAVATSDGSGNLLSKIIDMLFGNGSVTEGSIGGHTQQQLITNTGASRWFQVANDSMSWIPSSVWSELLMFLGITLGILVVAFILRIILDFL